MRLRSILLTLFVLAFAASCNADIIVFHDLSDDVSITINGVTITGNGGRVSNFLKVGEFISFDLSENGVAQIALAGFTNVLESDNTVSDRFVESFGPVPFTTYHVAFGSDPTLPAIPAGARDLCTVPLQALICPIVEDGTEQRVGQSFTASGAVVDVFAIQSDTEAPEPGSLVLLLTLILGLCIGTNRMHRHSAWRTLSNRP